MDVPVSLQHQVPIIQKAQKMLEVPQNQYFDQVVDMPVVMQQT